MDWIEAAKKFHLWHQERCKTTSYVALSGLGGCYPKGVRLTAEIQCDLCKETFHIKYTIHA